VRKTRSRSRPDWWVILPVLPDRHGGLWCLPLASNVAVRVEPRKRTIRAVPPPKCWRASLVAAATRVVAATAAAAVCWCREFAHRPAGIGDRHRRKLDEPRHAGSGRAGSLRDVAATSRPKGVPRHSGRSAISPRRADVRVRRADPRQWPAVGMVAVGTGLGPLPPDTEQRMTEFTDLVATSIANAQTGGRCRPAMTSSARSCGSRPRCAGLPRSLPAHPSGRDLPGGQ